MALELKLRNVDESLRDWNLAGSGTAPFPRFASFAKVSELHGHREKDLFFGNGPYNQLAAKKLLQCHSRAKGVPIGVLELNNVHVLFPYGLILDIENGVCWHGSLIGWTTRTMTHKFKHNLTGDGAALVLDFDNDDLADAQEIDECCLFSGAGFDIYGHWLVDYIPRLVSASRFVGDEAVMFATRPRAAWAQKMVEMLLPGQSARVMKEMVGLYKVRRLLVPTSVRYENSIEPERAAECWKLYAGRIGDAPAADNLPKKIVVSRRGWGRTRKLSGMLPNIEQIEDRLAEAGFAIISPEAFSLPEQKQIFENAEVVVGEDGSGLHNTIFSRPGTITAVITSGRLNLLPAERAGALGHRIV